jgi:hypothetical protein
MFLNRYCTEALGYCPSILVYQVFLLQKYHVEYQRKNICNHTTIVNSSCFNQVECIKYILLLTMRKDLQSVRGIALFFSIEHRSARTS